jgi:hypothetical protein
MQSPTKMLLRSCGDLTSCMPGGALLADAEATAKAELIAACRPKPGADTPFFSPEMVGNAIHSNSGD